MSLGNLLRCITKEYMQTWDQIIGKVEYAYNDIVNRSIDKSPFEVVYGLHPREFFELRTMKHGSPSSSYAEDFSHSMREVHENVRNTLTENVDRVKQKVDASKRDLQFQTRDLVMVHLNKQRL